MEVSDWFPGRAEYDPYAVNDDEVLKDVKRELLLLADKADDFYSELITEDQLRDLPPQEWVIDRWLPRGGYSIVFGPAGTGKTLVLLGMAKGISRGKRWQKAKCRHAAVLFLEGEGLVQLQDRSASWDEAYPRTGDERGVMFTDRPLDLTKAEGVAQVVRTARKLEANLDCQVGLVVVDPLAEYMTGSENFEGMALASKSLRVLAKTLDCAVLVGHHTGTDVSRERGYTQLRDKALVSMAVEKVPDGVAVVQRKNRHAETLAINLYFKPQGKSVIFEYDSEEMTQADYDRAKAERLNRIKEGRASEKDQRRAYDLQRGRNIVRTVLKTLNPKDVYTQNALVEALLEQADKEHAENPELPKIGKPTLVRQLKALADEGVEVTCDGSGQSNKYRVADQRTR